MEEVQDNVDGAMAPVEEMDLSDDDERLDDVDDIDEETDIKDEFDKEGSSPVSHLPPPTNEPPQPAAVFSKDRDDFLNARQLRIALFALCEGLHQASRVFSTDVQLIRSWLKEAQKRLKLTEQEQNIHADGRDRMVAWVLSMREQQLPITESSLFHKASMLKKKGTFSNSFRISYDWAVSFMLQHRLGVRSVIREAVLARSLPPSLEAKIRSFREFTHKIIQIKKLSQSTVAAMDELCLFVDLRVVQDKSRCSEALELTGSVPLVTVYLAVLADGTMLPSLVLANRQLTQKALPEFIMLEDGTDSLLVEEVLELWTNKVWLPHMSSLIQPCKTLLVLDRHREHLRDSFLTSISGSCTLPAMIPRGCSSHLQPLEVCMKPVLKRFLLSRWANLTSGNPKELEESTPQRLQANVAQLLVDWIVEALELMIKLPDLWRKSFQLTDLLSGQKEEDQEVKKMTNENQEKIQSDLIKTLAETLLGPEALEDDRPEMVELEDEDTTQGDEQGEREEEVSQDRKETRKEPSEDRKENGEEGKKTKEGHSLKELGEGVQDTLKGLENRIETERNSKETEERRQIEDLEEEGKETGEVQNQKIKDSKETEENREGEIGKKDNDEEGREIGDSEEEAKEREEERDEERRETRIVIGEEVGDEWKITVKSRTEGLE